MRDALEKRLRKIEKLQSPMPHAIVRFEDGRTERLNLGAIAREFLSGNRAGIVAVAWERGTPDAPLYQLLEAPGWWTELTAGFDLNEIQQKGLEENDTHEAIH